LTQSDRRPAVLQCAVASGVVIVALLLQGAYLANMISWRDAPDRGWLAYQDSGPDVVAALRPLGEQSGLRVADRILSVNDQTYTSLEELRALIRSEPGAPNVYRIERDGEPLEITVRTQPFGMATVLRQTGPYIVVGILFTLMGAIVFSMKPFTAPNWAFLSLATVMGVLLPFIMQPAPLEPARLRELATLFKLLLGAALIHMSSVFPQRRAIVADRWWLLALPYALSIAAAAQTQGVDAFDEPPWMVTVRFVLLGAGLLTFTVSTLAAYFLSGSSAARLQALLILTGGLVAFGGPFMDQLFTLAFGFHLIEDYILFTAVSLIAFPLSIGYGIARHDLFEIDVIVRRTYGYLLSTTLVVALYGATVALLNVTIGPSEVTQSPLFTIVFVLGVVFLMQPIQGRIQALVDKAFYRQKYDYRTTITQATDEITSLLEPDLVRTTLVGTVVREMFLENGLLLASVDGSDEFEVETIVGVEWPAARSRSIRLAKPVLEVLREKRQALFRHEIELAPEYASTQHEMLACFDKLEAELMLPMIYDEQLRAVLSIGRKKSGRIFRREDLDLLRTLVSQSSVALENARLFKDLADSLKRVQVLESVKTNLAKFVPQTVQDMIEESPDAEGLFEKRDRDLTVMFADMTGYTRLSSRLPIQEVNHIVERYFGAFLDEILRRGGDVNETAGDGLMVLFQEGEAHEHARAAVSAAVAIQRIARSINAERAGQIPIGMHIGVNSGTASVGATKIQGGAGMRWTYTASGPITNIAARVGAIGQEIAITDETRKRLGKGFVTEDLGPIELKNVDEPVLVHSVVGEAEPEDSITADEPESPLREADSPPRVGEFVITGEVRDGRDRTGMPGLLVRAFDRDLVVDDFLGSAVTDPQGRFRIVFTEEAFAGLFETSPDLYLRIYSHDGGRELISTRHQVRWNASEGEHYEIDIPAANLTDA